jgi:hypothetical protein
LRVRGFPLLVRDGQGREQNLAAKSGTSEETEVGPEAERYRKRQARAASLELRKNRAIGLFLFLVAALVPTRSWGVVQVSIGNGPGGS